MRFITPHLHGFLDYAAALALIIAPFVLGIAEQSALAHWISVAAGVGLITYSLITDYFASLAKLIPFKVHLALDMAAAVFFLVAPSVLGFTGIVEIYYYVMGAGVVMVVLLSNTVQTREAAAA